MSSRRIRTRRRKRASSAGVELNLAAMLDMAFQLLMFFILTFSTAPREWQIATILPPPTPITPTSATGSTNEVKPATIDSDVVVTAVADADGQLAGLAVDTIEVANLAEVRSELDHAHAKRTSVTLQVDARLEYAHLLAVIDACETESPLARLKIVELRMEAEHDIAQQPAGVPARTR